MIAKMRKIFCSCFFFAFLVLPWANAQQNFITFDAVCTGLQGHSVTVGDFSKIQKSKSSHVQTKSTGTFVISGNGIVWTTEKPSISVMVASRSKVMEIAPDGVRTVLSGNDKTLFSGVAESLASLFSGDMRSLQGKFDVQFLQASSFWKIVLSPKETSMKKVVSNITLGGKSVSDNDIYLDSLNISEVGGDSTSYLFRNQSYKDRLSDEETSFFTAE